MKILYVTTISNTVNTFLIPHIKTLLDERHQVDVAFNVEQEVKPEIYQLGCKVYELEFNRFPLSRDNFSAYKRFKKIIISEGYDLVHTHTPVASVIVRLVCRNLNNVRVFYTAHGFHFFKGAPLINWLVYYPVEKWLARYTDTLITINQEDYARAKNKFKSKRVEYIPGVGLDIERFRNTVVDKRAKRQEIGVPQDSFVILSVGELNRNKNHEVIIKAISKINNPKIHYVICGKGPRETYLKNILTEFGVGENVHLLGFRKDIPEIYKISDVFAFPSLREGLGMAALEAMACGLPLVTSNIHGIVDYSIDNKTGFSCNPKEQNGFIKALEKLTKSEELCKSYAKFNIDAVQKYELSIVSEKLKIIYED